jgi:hypothetical protein
MRIAFPSLIFATNKQTSATTTYDDDGLTRIFVFHFLVKKVFNIIIIFLLHHRNSNLHHH